MAKQTSSRIHSSDLDIAGRLTTDLAEPFAHALAVFVSELCARNLITRAQPSTAPAPSSRPRVTTSISMEDSRPASADDLKADPTCTDIDEVEMARRIAESIAVAIRKSGTPQRAIAARLKVNPSVVSRMLQKPENSSIAKLCKVAKAAGIQIRPAATAA